MPRPHAHPLAPLVLAAIALGGAPACTAPADEADTGGPDTAAEIAWVAPDEPGAFDVGATTLRWTDARGKDLVAEVWYPVERCDAPEPYEELPVFGGGCRNADPARIGAPYPLVAFSHGYGGIRYQSAFLTEALARHGYVVVAVDHPRNTLLDLEESAAAQVALERPGDVVAAVDETIRRATSGDPLLADLVETDRYGMTGHSFGAWTTLAIAGGAPDLQALTTLCAEDPSYELCGLLGEIPPGATVADSPDPRAVAAIPMAPGGWYTFPEGGFADAAPTLVFAGERDASFSVDREIRPLYDRLPAPKALGLLAGAGHYAFSDICRIGDIVDDCAEADGGYIEMDLAHTIVNELSIAWLGLHLRGDERYAEWLASRWPELTFEIAGG